MNYKPILLTTQAKDDTQKIMFINGAFSHIPLQGPQKYHFIIGFYKQEYIFSHC